jgi:hypothetical protein
MLPSQVAREAVGQGFDPNEKQVTMNRTKHPKTSQNRFPFVFVQIQGCSTHSELARD